jgi:hypothetical protein
MSGSTLEFYQPSAFTFIEAPVDVVPAPLLDDDLLTGFASVALCTVRALAFGPVPVAGFCRLPRLRSAVQRPCLVAQLSRCRPQPPAVFAGSV